MQRAFLGADPARQADLHAALLDVLGMPEVLVAAVSGGGPSAIHFAARHANRCRALILVSTPGGPIDTRIPPAAKFMMRLLKWRWFADWLRRRVEADPEKAAGRSVPDAALCRKTFADPEAAALFTALMVSTYDRAGDRLPGTLADMETTRVDSYPLESVAAPVLAIHGTVDPILPFDRHARPLFERLPRVDPVTAEGGGHTALFTHLGPIRERTAFPARFRGDGRRRGVAAVEGNDLRLTPLSQVVGITRMDQVHVLMTGALASGPALPM